MEYGEAKQRSKGLEATVLEVLPNAACRVQLEDRSLVIAHAAQASEINFVRLRPRDRVLVELSPHDPTRGRIVRLLEESRR